METDLGSDYIQQGNTQAALLHLKKAVSLSPYYRAYFLLGYLNENQGNLQQAQGDYYKAANAMDTYVNTYEKPNKENIQGDLDIYVYLAKVLLENNNYQAAEDICLRGLKYDGNSFVLWTELAASANGLKDQSGALEAMVNVNDMDPNDPEVYTLEELIQHKQKIPFALISNYIDVHFKIPLLYST